MATVYTVNGTPSGQATSLPDWLTRKRSSKAKGKRRTIREEIEGTINLIQHFEFPEASIKIKTTRDGHHAIATGVYKPQIRAYDLDQLALKFERHSDAENVDFQMLSDDWTKSIHLQNDRTVELHTQGGFHYRTRIPKFGRAIAYHYPSCDALLAATGSEVYRLNLDQGRFLNPLVLSGEDEPGSVQGVNAIDINPAHQLLAFGLEGEGCVELWDPRSRSRVGLLRLPRSQFLSASAEADMSSRKLSITALNSRSDGLSLAVGTSSGHTLLYDIRSPSPFSVKDQGYGLPIKTVAWIEGGSKMAGDAMVVTADSKVVKIWDRNSPSTNFASITTVTDINHAHHLPGTGLLMLANEGIQMTSYYIPQLGPAPRWCSFLDNITEEMEDQTVRSVYEDYKFVQRTELSSLGLDHLVGTPALKPYMHGYFLSLKLYDAARVIANPFAYAEHREKVIREKLDKLSESRIRAKRDAPKVNRVLAEKIMRAEEKEARKTRKRKEENVVAGSNDLPHEVPKKPSVLNDPRFKALFENPEFEVDEQSREFAMLNPASATSPTKRPRSVVDEGEEENDIASSDAFETGSGEDGDSDDSSVAGDLEQYNPRSRDFAGRTAPSNRISGNRPSPKLVPIQIDRSSQYSRPVAKDESFGQRRRRADLSLQISATSTDARPRDGRPEMEVSWIPSPDKSGRSVSVRSKHNKRKGVETFGAGMERGVETGAHTLQESERKGRTNRRSGVRSGSKNVFRQLS